MVDDTPLTPFFIQKGILILDGGLATELEARGHVLGDELWSARLLLDRPEAPPPPPHQAIACGLFGGRG